MQRITASLALLALLACAERSPATRTMDGGRDGPTADGDEDGGADLTEAGRCASGTATAEVTLRGLLRDLADLTHLTRTPSPRYVSEMASSHDRASDAAEPGSADWFANRDWIVPEPEGETTLLAIDGPGVLTRIWSANPSGTLRIYLDGASSPAIEAPMAELLGGGVEPFAPPYAFVAAGGHNFYFPVPYLSRCVVTVETDADRLFFQIDHRVYDAGADVETYSKAVLEEAACERSRTAQLLDRPGDEPLPPKAQRWSGELSTLDASTATQAFSAPAGGGVLRELRMKVQGADDRALRETALGISVDGEETVRVPLGDFFGTGPGWADVQSAPSEVRAAERELTARWPMPFERELVLSLEATSDARLSAETTVSVEPRPFDADTRLFHARWHPPEAMDSEPTHDWNVITLEGEGALVGNVLNVVNGNGSWWGEGDEKLYVDGESFPSHFGTGTEDFFGYAWCANELFAAPFVGQSRADPHRNYGAVSLYRFLLLDAVPFRERLVFDLEVNHWGAAAIPLSYDAVVYFYAKPGASASPTAQSADFRVPAQTAPRPAGLSASDYSCGP